MNTPLPSPRRPLCCLLFLVLSAQPLMADEATATDDEAAAREATRRAVAVTMNYCRASLHRIRSYPTKQVLLEEQQRILNNLNLNRIEDPEVIALYRSVLDEISQVEITERERNAIEARFRSGVQRQISTDFFVIGAQVATGQLGNVIRSGANSWWDYRSQEIRRESDAWKVEKAEFTGVVSRSGTFLDSFWKLSRKNELPDEWLLRDQDLDRLTVVLRESDPDRRMRMLQRMERFMTCYPPYWYYRARTAQQLNRLAEALETYQTLAELGNGHFREDEMLAGTMANVALLQQKLDVGDPTESARTAFRYSGRNWEANLVCAWILGQHEDFEEAEDRLLCNLDENLEEDQTSVALVSLYYHSQNRDKLAALLEREQIVHRIPIPGLLLCAQMMGSETLPEPARVYLASTLTAVTRNSAQGRMTISAAGTWKLSDARVRVQSGGGFWQLSGYRPTEFGLEAHFTTAARETTDPATAGQPIRLEVAWPDTPPIQITLQSRTNGAAAPARSLPGLPWGQTTEVVFGIESIELDGVRLSVDGHTLKSAEAPADQEKAAELSTGETAVRS